MAKPATQKTEEGKLLLVDFRNIAFVFNLREKENYGNLEELADSLAALGQAQPAKAKYDEKTKQWVLKDGHRRYLATKLNIEREKFNVKTQKFKIIPVADDYTQTDTLLEMFASNDSKPLEILEQAEGIKLLKAEGMSLKAIADKIGKPLPFIKNLDMLSKAPDRIKIMISSKKVSASMIINLLKKVPDFDKIVSLLEGAEMQAEQSGKGHKITQKHINKTNGVKTSMAYFKSIMNCSVEENIKPEKIEAFKLIRAIMNGELTSLQIEKEFLI